MATDMTRLPYSIRSLLWLTVSIAMILAFAIELKRRIDNRFRSAYRFQAMGDILVDYLERHDDWPTDWNQLRQFVESNRNNLHGVRTFNELQAKIAVDFSFEPSSMKFPIDDLLIGNSCGIVVARDGTKTGATHDPNVTIFRYLQQKHDSQQKRSK